MSQPVASSDFFVELKKLFPALAAMKNVSKLTITLQADDPVVVETVQWSEAGFGVTETKKFNLTEIT